MQNLGGSETRWKMAVAIARSRWGRTGWRNCRPSGAQGGHDGARRHRESFAGGGKAPPDPVATRFLAAAPPCIGSITIHHFPVFGIDVQGSFGGSGAPFCRSSIECLSGERTNAIVPSRGGRLM